MEFIVHLVHGTEFQDVRKVRSCGSDSREWDSLNFLFGVLILKTELLPLTAACVVLGRGREGRVQGGGRKRALMSLAPWKGAWQLVVVTQDGGLQLVLPGWPLGCCFPTASRARSQVIVLVEAWADSELGESRKSRAVSTCPRPSPHTGPQKGTLTALGTPAL